MPLRRSAVEGSLSHEKQTSVQVRENTAQSRVRFEQASRVSDSRSVSEHGRLQIFATTRLRCGGDSGATSGSRVPRLQKQLAPEGRQHFLPQIRTLRLKFEELPQRGTALETSIERTAIGGRRLGRQMSSSFRPHPVERSAQASAKGPLDLRRALGRQTCAPRGRRTMRPMLIASSRSWSECRRAWRLSIEGLREPRGPSNRTRPTLVTESG